MLECLNIRQSLLVLIMSRSLLYAEARAKASNARKNQTAAVKVRSFSYFNFLYPK